MIKKFIAQRALEIDAPLSTQGINRLYSKSRKIKITNDEIVSESEKCIKEFMTVYIPNRYYSEDIDIDKYVDHLIEGKVELVTGCFQIGRIARLHMSEEVACRLLTYTNKKYIEGVEVYLPQVALTVIKMIKQTEDAVSL